MSEMDLTAIMEGLAGRAEGLASNVYDYPAESVTVPCIVVGYPTDIEFDTAFQRGGDRLTVPVWYVVGKGTTKFARDALSVVLAGVASVKSQLDGDTDFGDVRVTDASIDEITIGAVTYIAARFDTEVLT